MIDQSDRNKQQQSQTLREFVSHYLRSTAILGALGAALDAITTGTPIDPALQARIDDVLHAYALDTMLENASTAEIKQMRAEIRYFMLLDAKLLNGATRSPAWNHTETEILQAGGEVSAGFAYVLSQSIVPRLDGLAQRLESPDASLLDVGVGVAHLSIALARLWPSLHIVGIDPWAPSLALARENVARAGLTDRITLRQQSVADLAVADTFDLVWLPSAFLPEQVIAAACERAYRALRPGGWLLFAMAYPGSDPLTASIVRLRTVLWGGSVLEPQEIESHLHAGGFGDVRMLPSPPGAIAAMIAARRMPELDPLR